jgi:imidazole glycerol phosphate synthase subunit HisF
MSNPVLCIIFAIKFYALDVYVLVITIEVNITDRSRLVGDLISNTKAFKERRYDEVDVLTWVWKEAKHAEYCETSHGARVVVSRQTSGGGVEAGWDICCTLAQHIGKSRLPFPTIVSSLCGKSGSACIVWHVNRKEDRFIANIC